jgi:hypothetical protein
MIEPETLKIVDCENEGKVDDFLTCGGRFIPEKWVKCHC